MAPAKRRGRILFSCAHGALHLTRHGPLQRELGVRVNVRGMDVNNQPSVSLPVEHKCAASK